MYIYVILSALILMAGIALTFRKTHKLEWYSIKLTLTVSLAAAVLVFPFFRESFDPLISALSSLKYGVGIIGIDIDEEILEFTSSSSYPAIGRFMLYAFYVLAPVLGSISVLSFSRTLVDKVRMRWSRDVHIFSSLNEKSVSIAECVRKSDKHAKIVFFKWKKSDDPVGRRAVEIDAILQNGSLDKFRFRKNRKY